MGKLSLSYTVSKTCG